MLSGIGLVDVLCAILAVDITRILLVKCFGMFNNWQAKSKVVKIIEVAVFTCILIGVTIGTLYVTSKL